MNFPRSTIFVSAFLFLFSSWFYCYQKLKPILPKKQVGVLIEGEVTAPPYFKGQSQYIKIGKVRVLDSPVLVRLVEVRVRFRATPKFLYGDQLRIRGRLTPYATMRFPEIEKVGEGGNPVRRALFRFRKRLEDIVCQALPEPEAGLLSGILLGSKHALSYDWEEVYKKTGLMHVVVASGYNITVLTKVLGGLFQPLGMNISFITALLGVSVFTLMLGAEPPILRASIMGVIALWGRRLGRPRDVLRALLFSVILMIFLNPLIIDSLSFKLSFAASLGLVLLATPLQERFSPRVLRFIQLDEGFFSTISASLFVFPIISYHFGQTSLGSFLVNTLVLWVVPYSMFFGSITVSVGAFSNQLAKLVGGFAWLPLRFFNLVASFFSKFPLVWEEQISFFVVFIYYLVLLGICWFFQIRLRKEESH